MKSSLKFFLRKGYNTFFTSPFQKELLKLINNEKEGKIKLFGSTFAYHHGQAFYNTFQELFNLNIYKFNSFSLKPIIIDCGANMGLSLLYFSREFPNAEIIAFEPDETVIPYLEQNILNFDMKNVKLNKKAVWSSNTSLSFYTDKGMGGRLENSYSKQIPKIVETIRLKDLLNKEIDFLKMDIEGAEVEVLKDCEEQLVNVKNIFVEYHSFENNEQELGELLNIFKKQGFRYHLKQSFSRKNPFISKALSCENCDMAINIFAYKN